MRWFLPDGITRPGHMPLGGIRTQQGPDGRPGLAVGGSCVGIEGWHTANGGWLFHVSSEPRLRVTLPEHTEIVAGGSNIDWRVPVLLRDGMCNIPCVWGHDGFAPPAWAREILDELAAFLESPQIDGHAVALACRVLAICYHLSIEEITAAGWLTDRATGRILLAAVGMDWRAI